jgi:hypothetical protein
VGLLTCCELEQNCVARLSVRYFPSLPEVRPFEWCCEQRIRAAGIVGPGFDHPFASFSVLTGWATSKRVLCVRVAGVEGALWLSGQARVSCGDKTKVCRISRIDSCLFITLRQQAPVTTASHFASPLPRRRSHRGFLGYYFWVDVGMGKSVRTLCYHFTTWLLLRVTYTGRFRVVRRMGFWNANNVRGARRCVSHVVWGTSLVFMNT